MKHFQTMTEAIRAAAQLCPGWLVLESGEYVETDAALYLAGVADRLDHEDDAASGTYYLVSDEGAVGVTSKYEYLAQWILIPLLRPMAEIEAELTKMMEGQKKQSRPGKSFCPFCGAKLNPGTKFCTECGRQI